MAVHAIIFDFGNVVGFFDHRRTSERLAPHSDLSTEALHPRLYGGELESAYDLGRISSAEFLRQARDHGRLSCSEEVIAAAWSDIFWPNAEVIALLPALKPKVRLLLGSNTNELHARHYCRQFADALRHFDSLVFSHEIGARKPDAAFFHHCQRLAGFPAEQCLFIDDLAANVAGAEACGLRGLVYTSADDLRRRLASLGVLPAL
jgi:putative hydrolase of the HAD superfamily